MFGRDWQPGQATIVAVRYVMTGFGGSTGSRAEFVADVQPEGVAPVFRATFKGPLKDKSFRPPEVGEVVPVEFEAKSGKVQIDTSDPAFRRDAQQKREQEQFDAVATAAPGSPVQPPAKQPDMHSALSDVSAAVGRMSAATTDVSETIAAIKRARASGDLGEVERLKLEFQRRSDETPRPSRQVPAAEASRPAPSDRLERVQKLADLRDRGVLTDAEFEAEKSNILDEG
jgi:hypothetical protein